MIYTLSPKANDHLVMLTQNRCQDESIKFDVESLTFKDKYIFSLFIGSSFSAAKKGYRYNKLQMDLLTGWPVKSLINFIPINSWLTLSS